MVETVHAVLDRLEMEQNAALTLHPGGNSLEFLQLVYRNPSLPLTTRMRAAMAALKHEVPTLGVSFVVNDADIADRLDRAIVRSQQMKLIEAKPEASGGPLIEAAPQSDARLPPSIPDRRFRRI